MLISARAYQALLDAGVQISAGPPGHVDVWITGPDGKQTASIQVKTWSEPLSPAAVRRLRSSVDPDEHFLLVAPSISVSTRALIEEAGWSWLSLPRDASSPEGFLQVPGWNPINIRSEAAQDTPAHRRTGRTPWGTFAVIRNLLTDRRAWSQRDLAEASSVSQPRVSQILAELSRDDLVASFMDDTRRPARPRWRSTSWDALLDRWLETYPGPAGVTTYWFGLDSVMEQTRACVRHVASVQPAHLGPVVSGDAAAEFVAPYRRPVRSIVYCRSGADLTRIGLTPAGVEEATLELRVPEDTSVWPRLDRNLESLFPHAPYPVADPVQVIWDLQHSPGPDNDQASDAVRQAFAKRFRHG